MLKNTHEIRDPVHTFIRLDSDERRVLNSYPFQRLRHIHQLASTYLLYPGATHRRFEHSLGVMELAGRVYDIITRDDNIPAKIRDQFLELDNGDKRSYWRRVVRMASLCHDMGHLPFSHGAEDELLPDRWNHERLTVEIIRSEEMRKIWSKMRPPLDTDDIVKLAVGQKELSKFEAIEYKTWESILSEIVVGDAFGVDRIDYLLRDSHHIGVAYGKFDHYRLIDTLKILPKSEDSDEPALGVEWGGLHSAEALLLARYFMYTQVYLHHVRRIYDIHLKDFLRAWLPQGCFSTDIREHLAMTDNEITAEMLSASKDRGHPGHEPARRLVSREHFKLLYQRNPEDVKINPNSSKAIYKALCSEFGPEKIREDRYKQGESVIDFPVEKGDGHITSSYLLSDVLENMPPVAIDYVYVSPEIRDEAEKWLVENREDTIVPKEGEEEKV